MGAAGVGIGDEIMAAGLARRLHAETGKRVRILNRFGAPRAYPLWERLEYIARPHDNVDCVDMVNGPGARPYITAKLHDKWVFDPSYRPVAGEVRLSQGELVHGWRARHYVIVEPHLKRGAPVNKDWGRERWIALVDRLVCSGIRVAQIGTAGTDLLPGVKFFETPTFLHACAVLAQARAAVLPEGGLHHAAAALGKRAVVIFGGYIGTETTGYATHINLGASASEACGMRVPCEHCREWMARIEPAQVLKHLKGLL